MRLVLSPRQVLQRYALLLLFAAVVVFFSLHPGTPQFASSANISNVLLNESLLGIMAVATTLPLVAGQIDISVGPTAGLASLLTAGMMQDYDMPVLLAVLVGLATGGAVGLVNGVVVTRFGLNSIIATLGTTSIVGALVLWYSGGLSILENIAPSLTGFASTGVVGLPNPFLVLVAVALVSWYVLQHTPAGRYLYSAGASPRAAELVGLSVPRLIRGSFLAAGVLSGLAGVLIVGIQGGASPQLGPNFTLPAIAATFLGATTIRPGTYNIQGTFAAVFFLAACVNGLTLLGAQAWVNSLFTGLALLIAVALSMRAGRSRPVRPDEYDDSPPTITPDEGAYPTQAHTPDARDAHDALPVHGMVPGPGDRAEEGAR